MPDYFRLHILRESADVTRMGAVISGFLTRRRGDKPYISACCEDVKKPESLIQASLDIFFPCLRNFAKGHAFNQAVPVRAFFSLQ